MHPDLPSAGHARHFQYRAAVDGLRGVAVLAVLGFHAFPQTVSGGYVGVDVFFVISGFLITSIIARQLQHGTFSFADFYWRRVRRLFPALILVLVATLTLGWLLLLPDELAQLGKHVGAASAFAANLAFWRESGYFDTSAELKPLLHLWSLGIEEQFYLVWPALLVALWKRRTMLFAVVSALVIGSFALSAALAHYAPIANFYSPASRFWELGAGCLLALSNEPGYSVSYGPAPRRRLNERWGNLLPWLGCTLIATAIVVFDAGTPFPGWPALLPVVGTLLILHTPEHIWFQRRVLGSRMLVGVGLISYALYLWHWPLLSFANILQADAPPAATRWTILALSFLLAWLTYRLVELPVRRGKSLRINLALITGAAAACAAGMVVYTSGGLTQRFDVDVQALQHDVKVDPLCLARMGEDSRINYCRASSARSPGVVFIGDSRAQAIYEGAAPLLSANHSLMLLGRGGCPPLLDVRIHGYDPNDEECEDVWRSFVRYIEDTKPSVVVIVGNGSSLITREEVELIRRGARQPEPKEATLKYGIHSLLRELTKHSRVIYVKEIPTFATAPSCFLRDFRLPTTRCAPERDRDRIEAEIAPYDRVLQQVSSRFPAVRLVDSIDVLCSSSVCSQRPAGRPIMYSDAIHLSPAGGRRLVEDSGLQEIISQNIRLAEAH